MLDILKLINENFLLLNNIFFLWDFFENPNGHYDNDGKDMNLTILAVEYSWEKDAMIIDKRSFIDLHQKICEWENTREYLEETLEDSNDYLSIVELRNSLKKMKEISQNLIELNYNIKYILHSSLTNSLIYQKTSDLTILFNG